MAYLLYAGWRFHLADIGSRKAHLQKRKEGGKRTARPPVASRRSVGRAGRRESRELRDLRAFRRPASGRKEGRKASGPAGHHLHNRLPLSVPLLHAGGRNARQPAAANFDVQTLSFNEITGRRFC